MDDKQAKWIDELTHAAGERKQEKVKWDARDRALTQTPSTPGDRICGAQVNTDASALRGVHRAHHRGVGRVHVLDVNPSPECCRSKHRVELRIRQRAQGARPAWIHRLELRLLVSEVEMLNHDRLADPNRVLAQQRPSPRRP